MLILAIIVFGMGAGWAAGVLLRRRESWATYLFVGLIGSFVGGLLASLIAGDGIRLRPSGLVGSIVGAIIVLLIWGMVQRPAGAKR